MMYMQSELDTAYRRGYKRGFTIGFEVAIVGCALVALFLVFGLFLP